MHRSSLLYICINLLPVSFCYHIEFHFDLSFCMCMLVLCLVYVINMSLVKQLTRKWTDSNDIEEMGDKLKM